MHNKKWIEDNNFPKGTLAYAWLELKNALKKAIEPELTWICDKLNNLIK